MIEKIHLSSHLTRKCTQFDLDDNRVPKELFSFKCSTPVLDSVSLPLPNSKSAYNLSVNDGNAIWIASDFGVTRYCENEINAIDRVQFFSADRDLPDNKVKSLMPFDNGVWVLTETGVSKIEMIYVDAEQKADILREETVKYVDRRGMTSQKHLAVPGDITTAFPYGHSDNDGAWTAEFTMAELFRYATLKREKGISDIKTIEAKRIVTRSLEALLLLCYVPCRGDGFVARSYVSVNEPLPDDGIFFRLKDGKAICADTTESRKRGVSGVVIDASAKIPERLRHLFTDEGLTENDLIYKADTSSDEITNHFLAMYFAHNILGPDDPELDSIIISTVRNLMSHIIKNNYVLADFTGKATTWAKWNLEYFATPDGYVDACLNSAQLLMYLKVTMDVTQEEGIWKEHYNHLVYDLGYADLTTKHFDRMYQISLATGNDYLPEIMYGDHMLAVLSFWGLCMLEKDETLLEKYRYAFKTWKTSIKREYNPGYYFPLMIACPDETVDSERVIDWFNRNNISRIASGVSLIGRHDVPVNHLTNGYDVTSFVLPPDESYISKYDRDPLEYKNEDSGGKGVLENCYTYTLAYWVGRYYGFID